jgi:hypothetical protein
MENKSEPRIVAGVKPLYTHRSGALVACKGFNLYQSNDAGNRFDFMGAIPENGTIRIISHWRLFQRLLRAEIHSALPIDQQFALIVARKKILRYDLKIKKKVSAFRLPRGTRPLNLCLFPTGEVYFGEYFSNPNRDSVHIYGSHDGGTTWQIAHTFQAGTIRHIHGLFYDEYRDGCWVLTGDTDKECQIFFARQDFSEMEIMHEGAQRFRAVSIIIGKNYLIIPTDTPVEKNWIQCYDLKRKQLLCKYGLPGSAFYTARAGKMMFISTVVEPSRVNRNKFCHIYSSQDDGETWKCMYSAEKDRWSEKYFQYGAFVLPPGINHQPLLHVYGQALKGLDHSMLTWRL